MAHTGGRTPVHPTPQAEKPHTLITQSSEGLVFLFESDTDGVKVLLDCRYILIFLKDGSQNFFPGFARGLFPAMDVDGFAVFSHYKATTTVNIKEKKRVKTTGLLPGYNKIRCTRERR